MNYSKVLLPWKKTDNENFFILDSIDGMFIAHINRRTLLGMIYINPVFGIRNQITIDYSQLIFTSEAELLKVIKTMFFQIETKLFELGFKFISDELQLLI